MLRRQKGDAYTFISALNYQPVITNDWYFPTDDEKWENGNYFLDGKAAKNCASEIEEKYGERLEDLTDKLEEIKETFRNDVSKIAEKAMPKREKKRIQYKPLVEALVKAYKGYKQERLDTSNEIAEIKMNIWELVKNYRKL